MLKLTLRSLGDNWIRFVLTSLAVVLGVSFVVASFMITDSLRSVFGDLAGEINAGKDLIVRGSVEFGERENDTPAVSEDLIAQINAIDGVDLVEGSIFQFGVVPVAPDGEAVETQGPLAGLNWSDQPELTQLQMIDGEPPRAADEFVLEPDTIDEYDFVIGETYTVVTPAVGPQDFRLTGAFQFGLEEDASVGALISAFEPTTAQEVLGYPNSWQEIWISVDDGSVDSVRAAIEPLLPGDAEVVSGQESEEEFEDGFESFLGPFRTIMLVFAVIVAFVSAFLIYNTFNIVLGQRIRELGLLRAIGATGTQVSGSVIIEAAVVGVAATLVGLAGGFAAALGIQGLFGLFGADFPDGPLPLALRTVVVAAIVGIGFTLVAAVLPAFKASTIPPIAALAEGVGARETTGRGRTIIGAIAAFIGIALTALGLFGSFDSTAPQLYALGAGALVVFIATAILSPLIAGPASRMLGSRPVGVLFVILGPLLLLAGAAGVVTGVVLAISEAPAAILLVLPAALLAYSGWSALQAGLSSFRLAGVLGRKNASESPQRTATTAIALTIGIALVTTVTVVGTSLKESFAASIDTGVTADFIFTDESFSGLPVTLADDVAALDEIGTSTAGRSGTIELDGDERGVDAYGFDSIGELLDFGVSEGSLDPSGVAIYREVFEDNAMALGDDVDVRFQSGDQITVPIVAVFDENNLASSVLMDLELFEANTDGSADDFVVARIADDAETEQARQAVESLVASYPGSRVEDQSEFLDRQESNLNNVLAIVNVFLLVAVLIALIGIINTLTLSVFERTREIGLMRAVGMSRKQTVNMIRWEAAIVALFGAVLGAIIGVVFGWAITLAVPDDFIDRTAVPVPTLVQFLVVAAVIGMLAAYFPARRASRMKVLDAIAHS
ncbi:MAG: ABC transporter permease [Acidimicrobiales bacterium]